MFSSREAPRTRSGRIRAAGLDAWPVVPDRVLTGPLPGYRVLGLAAFSVPRGAQGRDTGGTPSSEEDR